MIYDFWCNKCKRHCDFECLKCNEYTQILLKKLSIFEEGLIKFKDTYDSIDPDTIDIWEHIDADDDDIEDIVRLNMACAFDSAVELFDDVFNDASDYVDFESMFKINYPNSSLDQKANIVHFKR